MDDTVIQQDAAIFVIARLAFALPPSLLCLGKKPTPRPLIQIADNVKRHTVSWLGSQEACARLPDRIYRSAIGEHNKSLSTH